MKKILAAFLVLGSIGLKAQDLPQPSPSATVMQRVGLTDFTVAYSRPSVKGREIFGALVPYDKVWRTGANKATAVTFSTMIMVGNTKIEAGTYSLFTIPGEETWTIILNKNTELWGSDGYSEEQDVFRTEVEAMKGGSVETFTIEFQNVGTDAADLVIQWADVKVALPIKVDVQAQAIANIENALKTSKPEDLWRVNRNAATFYSRNDIDQEKALNFIETSLELNPESWYTMLIKGEILYNSGSPKEAVNAAQKAMEMGEAEAEAKGEEFQYASMVEGMIESWKASK